MLARRQASDPEPANAGFGAIQNGMLALLGLLLAFAFPEAGDRFDARRRLIVEETNALGTLIFVWTCFQPESNLRCGKINGQGLTG